MKRIFNLILAMYPILSGYGFSASLDFGSLLLFVSGLFCCLTLPERFKMRFPNGYFLFFVVAVFLSLVWARSIPMRVLLFSANLCFACSFSKIEYLWKYYEKIVWICCAFFVVQELSFVLIGIRPSGIISYLPTIYGDNSGNLIVASTTSERSSSFFLEPSYLAQFLIPYLIICLFYDNMNNWKKTITISIVILLIRSGYGILLLGVTWFLWFLLSEVKLRTKVFVLIGSICIVGILLYKSSVLDSISKRSSELLSYSGDEEFQSSGFIRFFRGYYAYANVPTLNKLFGMNPNKVQSSFENGIYDTSSFINGIQMLLFFHGIIGAFLYLRHIFLFPIKTRKKTLLVFSICIFVLMLGESFYLCSRLFLMTVFMFLMSTQFNANYKIAQSFKR